MQNNHNLKALVMAVVFVFIFLFATGVNCWAGCDGIRPKSHESRFSLVKLLTENRLEDFQTVADNPGKADDATIESLQATVDYLRHFLAQVKNLKAETLSEDQFICLEMLMGSGSLYQREYLKARNDHPDLAAYQIDKSAKESFTWKENWVCVFGPNSI